MGLCEMKNAKKIIIATIIAICVVGSTYLGIRAMLNQYDTGTATVWDVIAVNVGIKEYVPVEDCGTYEKILVRKPWSAEGSSIVQGLTFEGQMGRGYPYHDVDGNRIIIVGTDAWCPLFRVYEVSGMDVKS